MLSDEKIYDMVTDWFAESWAVARAIKLVEQVEVEVRKQDEALIQQLVEALETHGEMYPHMVKGFCVDAINAARKRLEGTQ